MDKLFILLLVSVGAVSLFTLWGFWRIGKIPIYPQISGLSNLNVRHFQRNNGKIEDGGEVHNILKRDAGGAQNGRKILKLRELEIMDKNGTVLTYFSDSKKLVGVEALKNKTFQNKPNLISNNASIRRTKVRTINQNAGSMTLNNKTKASKSSGLVRTTNQIAGVTTLKVQHFQNKFQNNREFLSKNVSKLRNPVRTINQNSGLTTSKLNPFQNNFEVNSKNASILRAGARTPNQNAGVSKPNVKPFQNYFDVTSKNASKSSAEVRTIIHTAGVRRLKYIKFQERIDLRNNNASKSSPQDRTINQRASAVFRPIGHHFDSTDDKSSKLKFLSKTELISRHRNTRKRKTGHKKLKHSVKLQAVN